MSAFKIALSLTFALFAMAFLSRPSPNSDTSTAVDSFKKILIFKKHQFEISTNASGAVRELVIQVSRNNQPLITIRRKTDGWVVDAETADLDQNDSPELYIYSCTYGSGAFGKVYAFEFFPDSFDAIHVTPLPPPLSEGYMGHDRYKIEDNYLIRQFPVYRAGDVNARATGGTRIIKYTLEDIDKNLLLTPRGPDR
ncbi:MAG: hypothetical protein U0X91_05410 [Spirosomataceae bacterium]